MTLEVSEWITDTADSLREATSALSATRELGAFAYRTLGQLGQAASRYREAIYSQTDPDTVVVYPLDQIKQLLSDALQLIDYSILVNQREDGLYHAYNLLEFDSQQTEITHLYPMLEGQVAVLSSGKLDSGKAIKVIQALFDSDVFRQNQNSFMLYPERSLPGFLQKNVIPANRLNENPLLQKWLEREDQAVLLKDELGNYRFNADLTNGERLMQRLDQLMSSSDAELVASTRQPLLELYEQVFNHKAFTGRSGGMFGFEGLGCIYWHMVAKLLLAVQEIFFHALDADDDQDTQALLAHMYYRVREGIGFNKSPAEYGAFPTDPYSHTPGHSGAQQPGMTGQVKEEILTRQGELGIRVMGGRVKLQPALLHPREFLVDAGQLRYLDVAERWCNIDVPAAGLAFTWCQVPFVYRLDDESSPGISVSWSDDRQQLLDGWDIPEEICRELFRRSGRVQQVTVVLASHQLLLNAG